MTTQHSGERVGEGFDYIATDTVAYAPNTTEEAAKALIKEARQHRRRRMTIQSALVLFATALVTLGVTLYETGGPGAATTSNDSARGALATTPKCSLKNLAVVSNYSGGAAGTLYYDLVLTASKGAVCSVAPLEARAYDATTQAFVGTAATVLPARSYTAASKRELANQRLVHGARAVVQLAYVDAAVGSSGCGVAQASELALWTSGNAHVVKYVRLALAGSPLKVCTTRSYLTLYWPVLRHANS